MDFLHAIESLADLGEQVESNQEDITEPKAPAVLLLLVYHV
jgi:hypothetical protein